MRKWILKGTTLKTPFHIALFRMKIRSLHFFQGRISAMPETRADLFLAISKTDQADQGFQIVDFMTFF